MLLKTKKILCCSMLAVVCLITVPGRCDEYVQTKTLKKDPDRIFQAARDIVRRYGLGTVLESDQQRHVLRLLVSESRGWWMNEKYAASYAVFTLESKGNGSTTKARLAVGQIDTQRAFTMPKPNNLQAVSFSKTFFRLLKNELHV